MRKASLCLSLPRRSALGLFVVCLLVSGCATREGPTVGEIMPPRDLQEALLIVEERLGARPQPEALLDANVVVGPLPVTRDGALLLGLARNRALAVQRVAPEIAAQQPEVLLGRFDPTLLATASHGRSETVLTQFDNRQVETTEDRLNGEGNILLPTGTQLFLAGNLLGVQAGQTYDHQFDFEAGVTQSFLEGRNATANLADIRQAENAVLRSQFEVAGVALDLAEAIEIAYWDLVLSQETLAIREFAIEIAQENLDTSQALAEFGAGIQANVVAARAEIAARRADLVDAQAAIRSNGVRLLRLLNPEGQISWLTQFEPQDPPEVDAVETNAALSAAFSDLFAPELAQARIDLANTELDVIVAKDGLLPRLDAFARYSIGGYGNDIGEAAGNIFDESLENYEIGLDFEFQPRNRSEKARQAQAELRQRQAELAIANLRQLLQRDAYLAALEAERQLQRIDATRLALESREEELRVESERFRQGIATNLDTLQVQRDLIQARLDEVTSRVRYIQALTRLYRAEGTLLVRRGVSINGEALLLRDDVPQAASPLAAEE